MHNAKRILWIMLAVTIVLALWGLNIELTYERNIRHMPTSFQMERHVITRLSRA